MAKQLKINVKNTQIAQALNLNKLKKAAKLPPIKPKKTTKKAKIVENKKNEDKAAIAVTKRKARIIPSIEEEKKALEAKEAEVVAKPIPKAKEVVEEVIEEKRPEIIEEPDVTEPKIEEKFLEKKEIEPPVTTKKITEKEIAKDEAYPATKKTKDLKAVKRDEYLKKFDSRDRMGLRSGEEGRWRKRRPSKQKKVIKQEDIIRPKSLKVQIPISLKQLAYNMKLKASELIARLLQQGVAVTLNDLLDDETVIQLLGHEFGCEITIDTEEEERLRITDKTIKEEIEEIPKEKLVNRPPVITFMGHVDHGKTSIIDVIRKSNIAKHEAGAITQHIGAFSAKTPLGSITILDTPGHEAFSEIRSRGAEVTDLVVLVIAGDEGIRDQTIEAIGQAKEANVPILISINKCDKAGFDAEKVYRQLTDYDLLPEAWGGTTITVNTSAQTNEGIDNLLEMLSLQSEMLELKADPKSRARGTVLETEMHKGLGATATILVQNGTLKIGDAIVFGNQFGRVKTMHDEFNKALTEAGPSTAIKITGLSGIAKAGDEFIVVENEKMARKLAEDRKEGVVRKKLLLNKKVGMELLLEKAPEKKKILPLILRADVQGSLEALKVALEKIPSNKVEINFVNVDIGEISESDIRLAAASQATIIGFHTSIESHAESLLKQTKIKICMHDIIYHAVDEIKEIMQSLLDKIAQENEHAELEVKQIFKSSHLGKIAGCIVKKGTVKRSHLIRVVRDGAVIAKDKIQSMKRVKEDLKEAQKGTECGIVLDHFMDIQEGDILQTYDVTYLEQKL